MVGLLSQRRLPIAGTRSWRGYSRPGCRGDRPRNGPNTQIGARRLKYLRSCRSRHYKGSLSAASARANAWGRLRAGDAGFVSRTTSRPSQNSDVGRFPRCHRPPAERWTLDVWASTPTTAIRGDMIVRQYLGVDRRFPQIPLTRLACALRLRRWAGAAIIRCRTNSASMAVTFVDAGNAEGGIDTDFTGPFAVTPALNTFTLGRGRQSQLLDQPPDPWQFPPPAACARCWRIGSTRGGLRPSRLLKTQSVALDHPPAGASAGPVEWHGCLNRRGDRENPSAGGLPFQSFPLQLLLSCFACDGRLRLVLGPRSFRDKTGRACTGEPGGRCLPMTINPDIPPRLYGRRRRSSGLGARTCACAGFARSWREGGGFASSIPARHLFFSAPITEASSGLPDRVVVRDG